MQVYHQENVFANIEPNSANKTTQLETLLVQTGMITMSVSKERTASSGKMAHNPVGSCLPKVKKVDGGGVIFKSTKFILAKLIHQARTAWAQENEEEEDKNAVPASAHERNSKNSEEVYTLNNIAFQKDIICQHFSKQKWEKCYQIHFT